MLREIASWLPQSATITAGGALRRGKGQDRIAFLASVRNKALAPLWTVRFPVLQSVISAAGLATREFVCQTVSHFVCQSDRV